MATGIIKCDPIVETLATDPSDANGLYVQNVTSNVYSFSQIHIYRYGKVVEVNFVMTVKNTGTSAITKGTVIRCFELPTLSPMYTRRSFCYGAQSTNDYYVSEGFVSITTTGVVNFIPITDLAAGAVRTFRFNDTYLTTD